MRWTATDALVLNRRRFLAGLGLTTAAALMTLPADAAVKLLGADLDEPLFASARRNADGSHAVAILTADGRDVMEVPLPARGHGVALSPDGRRLAAFARRPGQFIMVIDRSGETPPQLTEAEPGRHYYGHGVFSADGRLLYAVENAFGTVGEETQGRVGVYDASGGTLKRIGECATPGIGPHDILLAEHGRVLVAANGGIDTHPVTGREMLNLDTMKPSIVYLDAVSGALLARHELDKDLHQLSLRHMALDGRGQVWVGGQFEGEKSRFPQLVVRLERDRKMELVPLKSDVLAQLDNYIGSVSVNASGDVVALSCPRGGRILYMAADSGALLGLDTITDGCGLAAIDEHGFLVSDGNGGLSLAEDPGTRAQSLAFVPGISWDNHMLAL